MSKMSSLHASTAEERASRAEEEVARLNEEKAILLAACQAVVRQYDELHRGMDTEYAAFFTSMKTEVAQARDALASVSP
jgi:predicted nuclease with TOPRIM domain